MPWIVASWGAARLVPPLAGSAVIRPSAAIPTKGVSPRWATPARKPWRYSFCSAVNSPCERGANAASGRGKVMREPVVSGAAFKTSDAVSIMPFQPAQAVCQPCRASLKGFQRSDEPFSKAFPSRAGAGIVRAKGSRPGRTRPCRFARWPVRVVRRWQVHHRPEVFCPDCKNCFAKKLAARKHLTSAPAPPEFSRRKTCRPAGASTGQTRPGSAGSSRRSASG